MMEKGHVPREVACVTFDVTLRCRRIFSIPPPRVERPFCNFLSMNPTSILRAEIWTYHDHAIYLNGSDALYYPEYFVI